MRFIESCNFVRQESFSRRRMGIILPHIAIQIRKPCSQDTLLYAAMGFKQDISNHQVRDVDIDITDMAWQACR